MAETPAESFRAATGFDWPDTPAAMATAEEAQIYWDGSVFCTGLGLTMTCWCLRRYLIDPDYMEPGILAFIPLFIGNFFFCFVYGIHHLHNAIYGAGYLENGGSLLDSGIWCSMTTVAAAGIMMKFFALVFVAWVCRDIIRSSKLLRAHRVSPRLLRMVSGFGFLFCFVSAQGAAFIFGTSDRRHLYCISDDETRFVTFSVILLVAGLCLACSIWLYRQASLEVKLLGQLAHSDAIEKHAVALSKHGKLSFLVTLILWSPAVFDEIAHLCGVHTPIGVSIASGWFLKLTASADAFCVILHVRRLHRVLDHCRGSLPTARLTLKRQQSAADLDTESLCNRGVSIDFLLSFCEKYDILPEMTTGDVCQKMIHEATSRRQCPYVDTVLDLRDQHSQCVVGKAQCFVSHCWAGSFLQLVEQCGAFWHQMKDDRETVYFWIDIFAVNQHKVNASTELPAMHMVIKQAEFLVLSWSPWDAPMTLNRVWCLWELLQALQYETHIRPVMADSEKDAVVETVRNGREKILSFLDSIDVTNASATKEKDKLAIFSEIIQSPYGFDGLNEMLRTKLKICLQSIFVGEQSNHPSSRERRSTTAKEWLSAFGHEWSEQRTPDDLRSVYEVEASPLSNWRDFSHVADAN